MTFGRKREIGSVMSQRRLKKRNYLGKVNLYSAAIYNLTQVQKMTE
uniref:Uncharacterized protein n=1 Tax=Arundo donax TaxID=35708 RepID=A0A0A8Y1B7_ARUDO